MDYNYQRKGSTSNTQVGTDFEELIKTTLEKELQIELSKNIEISIGLHDKRIKKFDIGSEKHKVVIECKSHTWTESGNIPSAKVHAFLYDMYCFSLVPSEYKKIFVLKKDYNIHKKISLAEYYIQSRAHLIPKDLIFYEYDEETMTLHKLL